MKVKLQNVRLAFPDLFVAKEYQNNGKPRYGATFLIEPGSENDKAIRAAIAEVTADKWGKTAAAKLEQIQSNTNKNAYTKGDLKEYDGFAGKMALSARRGADKGPVTVIDRDKSPLGPQSGRPYAGCYVHASVEIYAQTGENWGLRCALGGVQFVKDGDAFAAAPVSPDEFDDLGVEETAEV